jgi:predicted double-glycine peptidase
VELAYFNQGEQPWAEGAYGPDLIEGYGCGPTCLAMLITTLGEQPLDPIQAAQAAYEAGYCAPGSGSYHSIVEGLCGEYGLEAKSFTDLTSDALCQELASGHLFVALMGKGHFTNKGHFIILRGITLEGKVLVADPNSRERSLIAWDPQLILDELSSSRSDGAPLWCISTLEV